MTGIARNRAMVKYLAAVILFGSNGVVASQIAMSSYDIVFTRTLIGSLFLTAVFLATRARPVGWRNRRQFAFLLASGIAMGVSWLLLFEAYAQVGVSVAILAYYCGPVIVMMLAPVVFRERLALASVIGFAAVIVGMLCVNGQALLVGGLSPGLIFGVLAAVTYAAMVIFNKKAGSITGLENPMWQLIAAFGTVALFIFFRRGLAIHVPPGSWLPVLVLGLLNTGVGCYLYFSSIGALRAQSIAILGYLEPLSALLFAAAFLGESLGPVQMIGAALILGGAVFGELLRLRTLTKSPAPVTS
ncbi:MAG: DMT family transporter, partial [Anaerolinea sp.]|nr:DMT family transporter [Anaerolinea sp.]